VASFFEPISATCIYNSDFTVFKYTLCRDMVKYQIKIPRHHLGFLQRRRCCFVRLLRFVRSFVRSLAATNFGQPHPNTWFTSEKLARRQSRTPPRTQLHFMRAVGRSCTCNNTAESVLLCCILHLHACVESRFMRNVRVAEADDEDVLQGRRPREAITFSTLVARVVTALGQVIYC